MQTVNVHLVKVFELLYLNSFEKKILSERYMVTIREECKQSWNYYILLKR